MQKSLKILGIPIDLGQSRRGVDMGPFAIRYAGLREKLESLGYNIEDSGNLPVPVRDNLRELKKTGFMPALVPVLNDVYNWARKAIEEKKSPLFLGGDHSIVIGTLGGVTHEESSYGVIYIDAHGDANTPETTPSGNIHGMPLAVLLGHGDTQLVNLGRPGPKIDPENVAMIAIRDLDPGERTFLRKSGIQVYTMRDIDELGIGTITHRVLEKLGHVNRIHVSLDMDAIDPKEAPGVGTPVPGGLSYREAHLLMEILADSKRVESADIVEINPILDQQNKTGVVAVQLLASLCGKSII